MSKEKKLNPRTLLATLAVAASLMLAGLIPAGGPRPGDHDPGQPLLLGRSG